MAWTLTKQLVKLRSDFNARFPSRDRKSDGSVGDLAHQTGSSGHNPDKTGKAEYRDGDSLDEVRAIDVDKDLKDKYGVTMEIVIQHFVTWGRAGRYLPFRYFIYRGRIWRKSNGWKTETYTGPNGHYEHAHFSGDYSQKADNYATFDFGLLKLGIPITPPKQQVKEDKLATSQSEFDGLVKGADVVPRFSGGKQVPKTDGNPTVGLAYSLGELSGATQRLETEVATLKSIVTARDAVIVELQAGMATLLDRTKPAV